MDKIRIGVVGLGFGQHHVRTLANLDHFDLIAVADRQPNVTGGLAGYAAAYGATPYEDAFRHFAHCVRSGESPSCSVEDGIRSVKLAMAVYESARSGQVVDIQ